MAFSLIILAMMLTIAMGIASVELIQKKNASSTQFSVQAYQVADGGTLYAFKKIDNARKTSADIKSEFSTCTFPGDVKDVVEFGGDTSFDLSFYDADGLQLGCDASSMDVANIKSVGRFHNTVRAVNIGVEAATPPTP